jgi:hypothetical protein
VHLCTSDVYVILSVCEFTLLIMGLRSMVVIFIEIKVIVVVVSLRAKTGINTIFPLSKKDSYLA